MAVKFAQSRAAADRQLLKSKVLNSRKSIEDSKRSSAAEEKNESRKHNDMYYDIRVQEELEKRKKADEEKRRYENHDV
jgi:hypothetical protein